MMTTDQHLSTPDALLRRIAPMLLGSRQIKLGLTIIASDRLDLNGRVEIGRSALDHNLDIVHVAIDDVERPGRPEITLFIPQDGMIYLQTGCRLWLPEGGRRALIARQEGRRGHYRLLAGEILQVDRALPGDREAGLARAEALLNRQLLRPASQVKAGQLYSAREAA